MERRGWVLDGPWRAKRGGEAAAVSQTNRTTVNSGNKEQWDEPQAADVYMHDGEDYKHMFILNIQW